MPTEILADGFAVDRFEARKRAAGVNRVEYFEMYWVRGVGTHCNDFDRYPIKKGRPAFVFVSPGQLFGWVGETRLTGTVVSFTPSFIDALEPAPGVLVDCGYVYRREYPPVLTADDELVEEFEPVLHRLEKEYRERREGWPSVSRAALRLLLGSACRAFRRGNLPHRPMGRSRSLVRKFQMLVEERFRAQPPVTEYAESLGVTPSHLSDVVRDLTGATAGDVIRQRVMLEARRLLYETEMSVSEVAFALGFEDPSYFARSFRKTYGESPAEFRKKYRNLIS